MSISAFNEKHEIPLNRLHYVYHNEHFESDDGRGASTDYQFFGFDRKEFSDFMARLGEPMDLLCLMPQALPVPVVAVTPEPVPAQTAEPDAVVSVAMPASGSLLTRDIAVCFADIYYSEANWKRRTSDTRWIQNYRAIGMCQ